MRAFVASVAMVCACTGPSKFPCGSKPFAAPEPPAAACKRFQRPAELVAFLSGLPARADHRVLSGEFVTHAGSMLPEDLDAWVENNGTSAGPEMACVRQLTGKWPAIAGVDYYPVRTGHAMPAMPNRILVDWAAACGLGLVSLQMLNVVRGTAVNDRDVPFDELVRDGTAADAALRQELDLVAAGLLALQDRGLVVFFEPFAEMNADGSWWGRREPAQFVALWRRTWAYLTATKGLHNLVWLWAPRAGEGRYRDYYPGDDVVDVVGLTYYGSNVAGLASQGYAELVALHKPFGLAEFGPFHPLRTVTTAYDYARLITDVRASLPKVVFWQSWNAMWGLSRQQNAKALLADPWVVNRGDIQ